ncbi:hypothetical protein H9P43_002021 [Blastocladiella emersonii ATCC 22665]|nr:hypothetical protein H9P43_002021 [Blastocladiella emersonii ATCC 22665]
MVATLVVSNEQFELIWRAQTYCFMTTQAIHDLKRVHPAFLRAKALTGTAFTTSGRRYWRNLPLPQPPEHVPDPLSVLNPTTWPEEVEEMQLAINMFYLDRDFCLWTVHPPGEPAVLAATVRILDFARLVRWMRPEKPAPRDPRRRTLLVVAATDCSVIAKYPPSATDIPVELGDALLPLVPESELQKLDPDKHRELFRSVAPRRLRVPGVNGAPDADFACVPIQLADGWILIIEEEEHQEQPAEPAAITVVEDVVPAEPAPVVVELGADEIEALVAPVAPAPEAPATAAPEPAAPEPAAPEPAAPEPAAPEPAAPAPAPVLEPAIVPAATAATSTASLNALASVASAAMSTVDHLPVVAPPPAAAAPAPPAEPAPALLTTAPLPPTLPAVSTVLDTIASPTYAPLSASSATGAIPPPLSPIGLSMGQLEQVPAHVPIVGASSDVHLQYQYPTASATPAPLALEPPAHTSAAVTTSSALAMHHSHSHSYAHPAVANLYPPTSAWTGNRAGPPLASPTFRPQLPDHQQLLPPPVGPVRDAFDAPAPYPRKPPQQQYHPHHATEYDRYPDPTPAPAGYYDDADHDYADPRHAYRPPAPAPATAGLDEYGFAQPRAAAAAPRYPQHQYQQQQAPPPPLTTVWPPGMRRAREAAAAAASDEYAPLPPHHHHHRPAPAPRGYDRFHPYAAAAGHEQQPHHRVASPPLSSVPLPPTAEDTFASLAAPAATPADAAPAPAPARPRPRPHRRSRAAAVAATVAAAAAAGESDPAAPCLLRTASGSSIGVLALEDPPTDPAPKVPVAPIAAVPSAADAATASAVMAAAAAVPVPSSRFAPPGERKCVRCGTTESPEWRRGASGARELCNACGLKYYREKKQREKMRGWTVGVLRDQQAGGVAQTAQVAEQQQPMPQQQQVMVPEHQRPRPVYAPPQGPVHQQQQQQVGGYHHHHHLGQDYPPAPPPPPPRHDYDYDYEYDDREYGYDYDHGYDYNGGAGYDRPPQRARYPPPPPPPPLSRRYPAHDAYQDAYPPHPHHHARPHSNEYRHPPPPPPLPPHVSRAAPPRQQQAWDAPPPPPPPRQHHHQYSYPPPPPPPSQQPPQRHHRDRPEYRHGGGGRGGVASSYDGAAPAPAPTSAAVFRGRDSSNGWTGTTRAGVESSLVTNIGSAASSSYRAPGSMPRGTSWSSDGKSSSAPIHTSELALRAAASSFLVELTPCVPCQLRVFPDQAVLIATERPGNPLFRVAIVLRTLTAVDYVSASQTCRRLQLRGRVVDIVGSAATSATLVLWKQVLGTFVREEPER